MTKQQFQKELLEKIKPGTKPSDLKKRKIIKPKKDEGYSSGEEQIIPKAPPLPNKTIDGQTKNISTTPTKQIKDLQSQVQFWSNTANNHLKNLQLAQAKVNSLEEQIQALKKLKTPPKESELLKEKNKQIEIIAKENEKNSQRVSELQAKNQVLEQNREKLWQELQKNHHCPPSGNGKPETKELMENIKPEPIKTFLCSDCNQTKPHSELSRVFGKFSFCLECSKQARLTATQQKQPPIEEFICHLCSKGKKEVPVRMKLDQTLTEYLICQECRPHAKEFNEADLITNELWEKYPYSSASEILELEFGIVRNK